MRSRGLGDAPATPALNDLVVTKGITIYGIFGRRIWETWERTSAYLSTGKVDVSPLITHRFPLDDFQDAMAKMKSGRSGKVVLLPNGGEEDPMITEKKSQFLGDGLSRPAQEGL